MGRRIGSGKGQPIKQPKGGSISLTGDERKEVLRLRGNLTQGELAKKAGVSPGTISNIEQGTARVKHTVYLKVMRALKSEVVKPEEEESKLVAEIAESLAFLDMEQLSAVRTMAVQMAKAKRS